MKKRIVMSGIISIVLWFGGAVFAADRVVVIPLGSSVASPAAGSYKYSIPGTSFLPLRGYGQTEAAGYEVNRVTPVGLAVPGYNAYGVVHNRDAKVMAFIAPVHIPDGAMISYIGAAVCSEDDTLTDHNIVLELVATDMTGGGAAQTVLRSYTIISTDCGTRQGIPEGYVMLKAVVDNSTYAYEFRISGIEGGTCVYTSLPVPKWDCDDRRTRVQFADLSYSIGTFVEP